MSEFKTKKYGKSRKMSARYVNRYISLNCSAEMQELKLFPNLKEIQESFALFHAVEKVVLTSDTTIKRDNPNIGVFVVGDGFTPRTAALFAFLTKWYTISIDPNMRVDEYKGKIDRLELFQDKGENVAKKLAEESNFDKNIIIFPHSHIVDTNLFYKHFIEKDTWIVNMPCCYPHQDQNLKMDCLSYRDMCVDSPKNEVRVYCNYMDLVFA